MYVRKKNQLVGSVRYVISFHYNDFTKWFSRVERSHSHQLLTSCFDFGRILSMLQTDTFQYSGAYASMGVDNGIRVDNFRDNFRVEVIRLTDEDMEFDMIGIDPALANAFRRILISEVHCSSLLKKYSLCFAVT